MKTTKEFTPKPFSEITYNQPVYLYDADAEQHISFVDERYTPQGVIGYRVAHIFKPLSDERFIQREKELTQLSKVSSDAGFEKNTPDKDLWNEICIGRIGYKEREDWREKVKTADMMDCIRQLIYIKPITDKTLSDDLVIDEDELSCIKFAAFFGGIPLDDWRNWFETGDFPQNFTLTESEYYEYFEMFQKDISPNILLKVGFYFREPSDRQIDQATEIIFGKQSPTKLASAAREKLSAVEQLVNLFEVCEYAEGYKGRVPAIHKASAAVTFYAQEIARIKKSENE